MFESLGGVPRLDRGYSWLKEEGDVAAHRHRDTLCVESVQRTRQFYERLGWHGSSASHESIVFFRAGGIALALYPLAELAKDANRSADGQGFGGISLAYNGSSRVMWIGCCRRR